MKQEELIHLLRGRGQDPDAVLARARQASLDYICNTPNWDLLDAVRAGIRVIAAALGRTLDEDSLRLERIYLHDLSRHEDELAHGAAE